VHEDAVTIRRRFGDGGDADGAACARTVLDHDRLIDLLRHLLEHDASDDVVGGAGGKGNDRLNGVVGPGRAGLSLHRRRRRDHQSQGAGHGPHPQ
jgi:hypothetical protein